MHKKFPLLPKYLRNSFLGKFIFDKYLQNLGKKLIYHQKVRILKIQEFFHQILKNA